ncbi:MAG: hypothetical protein QOI11_1796 [Candidatus Eremiobacteraeota bacterium]|jgi:hypothetical protein|nr:hypothetical protein [Candidatus Eremiobacteraeota bacterium]
MNATYTQPCEYAECNCQVTGAVQGAAYCSDVCRERDTTDEEMELVCVCGHPPCDVE